jgi:hypothetical protein
MVGRADQGIADGRWAVIPRVLCFLFRGDQVLLLQRSPSEKSFPGALQRPGRARGARRGSAHGGPP